MFSFWDDDILLRSDISIDIDEVNCFINGDHNTRIAMYQQHIGQSINSHICQAFVQEIPHDDREELFKSIDKQALLRSLPYMDYYQARGVLREYHGKIDSIIEILNHVEDQQQALLIFALTKIARIRIFHNMDEESKDRVIRSLSGKAVYNGGKQMGAVALGIYGAYPPDWIKLGGSCASCGGRYSFGDAIWRANCWDHTYHEDCLFDHYGMNP